MAKNLEKRKVQPRDFESLTSLYSEVYGAYFSSAYWDWKYFKNPYGDNMMYVALDGERVVGEVGTIPVNVKCGDGVFLSSQTCDITVLPEYQKGGPFLDLYKLSNEENYKRSLICYGFSVPVTLKISSKLLKFRPICPVWKWVLVLNPAPYLAKKFHIPFLASIASSLSRLFVRICLSKHQKPTKNKIIEINRFDERFDRFWEERKHDYEIMVVRDSEYLNWRYTDHSMNHYKIFAYISDNRVRGFTVLSTLVDEVRRGVILELMADPVEEDVVDCLLSASINFFYDEKTDSVTLWLPEQNPLVRKIEQWGFVRRETQHNLIVKIYSEDADINAYIMTPNNWFFTMGDSDYH